MQNKYDFFSFSKTFSCFGGVKRAGNSPLSRIIWGKMVNLPPLFCGCGKKVYILKSATNSDADLFCCLLFHLTIVLPLQT